MQYRKYGNTGAEVSVLGFGAMRLPQHEDGTCDIEKSIPILQAGIDQGINYIDTAYVYIKGTSEVAVGAAIKKYDRESLYLATKIPVNKVEESTAEVFNKKLAESLARFDTPYIDFLLFHGCSWEAFTGHITKPGHALEAAKQAKAEGKIRHICFSSHDVPENIIKLINTGEFEGILLQYNYLDNNNEEAIDRAVEMGMGVTIMGPIAGGRLVVPGGVIKDEEGGLEIKTPELALRFVWNNPNVSVALSGMSTIEMVNENIASAENTNLDEKEVERVLQLVEQNKKLADLYCTGCEYCLPCPNDVNIPENFRYMNWFKVWGMEDEAKKAYANLGKEGLWTPWNGATSGLNAEACIQCGECEPKCPQNIPIIDQLEEVVRTLAE